MNNTLKGKYLEPSEHDSLWGLKLPVSERSR